ncbi:TEF transcription factor, PAR bZIP family member b isoform X3 [Cyclopterus lumpus]|uniref:TEF transcription factor, PAR bZIP family member b isoform X3 n=1 Tax=Cyclopterus lumpus TaxID=8103 RepID=UPI00148601E5|nr:TEF transcription factor, PAR bZIP family member b isoform X3 [Cyclopterus lumpus]
MSTANQMIFGDRSDVPDLLKSLADSPFFFHDTEIEKEKLCSSEHGEGGGAGAASAGAGSRGGGGGGGGVSASLTPAIWDKTIPYDGETFHLEYMDLDEFLLENGIPVTLEEEELQKTLASAGFKGKFFPKVTPIVSTTTITTTADAAVTPDHALASPPSIPATSMVTSDPEEAVTVTTLQPAKLEEEEEEENDDDDEEEDDEEEEEEKESLSVEATAEVEEKKTDRNTPSPIDPEAIEVDINFQPDPTDLVLSSVPGGELFNPRKHKFSDEELKPQPMIKKAKKVFVPDEQKDDKYWSRRKKNNVAAKRSRDARRLKENQITVRASFLERENAALRQQVAEMRKDCGRCKNVLSRYEAKFQLGHKPPRESKFALLSSLTSSSRVELRCCFQRDTGVFDAHWQAVRHDGRVVPGRPVESAWLLHSGEKGTIVDTPRGQTHGKSVLKGSWLTHGRAGEELMKARERSRRQIHTGTSSSPGNISEALWPAE